MALPFVKHIYQVHRTPCTLLKLTVLALKWGIEHEEKAKQEYLSKMKGEHRSFIMIESGLHMNPEYPVFGASPDAMISCECCGAGCVEIKCPARLKSKDATHQDLDFLKLDNDRQPVGLQEKHAYYFQVQCQMHIAKQSYCDFVVWSPHLLLLKIRIFLIRNSGRKNLCRLQCFTRNVSCPRSWHTISQLRESLWQHLTCQHHLHKRSSVCVGELMTDDP
ncbi:uncharacterized protein LOC112573673 [Pomacea canaliculata]|uniref:uncharacterized protein LOC112573673 n=1 Tax=Pomacea canaliculata TaxID=400727 RepID=UPI000D72A103|nr:uncharacterized protein LOC112573673 [Pomacea canaliculata]